MKTLGIIKNCEEKRKQPVVNEEVVNHLLHNMEGHLQELRSATDINYGKFIYDIRSQRFIERTIHILIEICFDIVHHIISDQGWREPTSYADAFSVLAENNVIDAESVIKYRLMAQFRNKLVHYYEKIEPEQVFTIFSKHLTDFDQFIHSIKIWFSQRHNSS